MSENAKKPSDGSYASAWGMVVQNLRRPWSIALVVMCSLPLLPEVEGSGTGIRVWGLVLVLGLITRLVAGLLRKELHISPKAKVALWMAGVWFAWQFLTAVLSGSAPASLLHTFFFCVYFWGGLLAGVLFFGHQREIMSLALGLGLVLTLLVLYTLWFSSGPGKSSPKPFFMDGNYFSAAVALVLPLVGLRIYAARKSKTGWAVLSILLFLVLCIAVVLMRSRGAWVGVAAAATLLPVFMLRIRHHRIVALLALVLVWAAGAVFLNRLGTQADQKQGLAGHVLSIGDTRHNFSNLERLTRWTCAWRMARERPVFGYGPGEYAPAFKDHLHSQEEVERISYWHGWKGGAHSDALTALAETGFAGMLMMVLFFVVVATEGLRGLNREVGVFRGLRIALLLSLFTWMAHSFFNDLLSSGSIAAMVGCMAGAIVAGGDQNGEDRRQS